MGAHHEIANQVPSATTPEVICCRMDRDMVLRHLAEAERHIVQGETHLARQFALIAELERRGHDTRCAPSGPHHHEKSAGALPAGSGTHSERTAKVRPRAPPENALADVTSEPLFDFSVGSLRMFESVSQRSDPRCCKLSPANQRCHEARDALAATPHPTLLKAFGRYAPKRGSAYLNARSAVSQSGMTRGIPFARDTPKMGRAK
jgi:hypothetical protein